MPEVLQGLWVLCPFILIVFNKFVNIWNSSGASAHRKSLFYTELPKCNCYVTALQVLLLNLHAIFQATYDVHLIIYVSSVN